MGVKQNSQRVFILVIVVAFLLSSIGFTGLVIYEALFKKDTNTSSSDAQKQLEEQLKNQSQEGKLQGTKLGGFTPVDPVTELKVVDLKEGTGAVVAQGATVTAHYTGALAKDGTIFESSKDSGQPATFPLSGVIQGWQQGVPGMKVGGIRRIIIPAPLAYGDKASEKIPANSALVFDIEMVETK